MMRDTFEEEAVKKSVGPSQNARHNAVHSSREICACSNFTTSVTLPAPGPLPRKCVAAYSATRARKALRACTPFCAKWPRAGCKVRCARSRARASRRARAAPRAVPPHAVRSGRARQRSMFVVRRSAFRQCRAFEGRARAGEKLRARFHARRAR